MSATLQAPADCRQDMTAARDDAGVSFVETRRPGVAPIGPVELDIREALL